MLRRWQKLASERHGQLATVSQHFAKPVANGSIRIVIRHDLDTLTCVHQASKLLQIQEDLGIKSSWFLRVDEYQYTAADARELVAELRLRDHDVGIHSAPYLYSDPFGALADQITLFTDSFGFTPNTFTIHGLPFWIVLNGSVRRSFALESPCWC
jgi:hypothetical protein